MIKRFFALLAVFILLMSPFAAYADLILPPPPGIIDYIPFFSLLETIIILVGLMICTAILIRTFRKPNKNNKNEGE